MPAAIKLSVIIPAYNEAANFKIGKLEEVDDYLGTQSYGWEVIVVDDGPIADFEIGGFVLVRGHRGMLHS